MIVKKRYCGNRISGILTAFTLIVYFFSGMQHVSAETADPLLEIYQQNQYQDPERFTKSSMLAKASLSYDSVAHNPRFDDYVKLDCIDVSKYQGYIEWNSVAADDIEQAIVRIGFRGYGNGELVADPNYLNNLEGASAAGLDTGVYFFSQAITVEEAIEEADFVLNLLQGFSLTMPVYLDIEEVTYDHARLDEAHLSYQEQTEICRAFCSSIEAGGYQAGVYSSKYYLETKIDAQSLAEDYSIWLANYNFSTAYAGDYQIWQYSENGAVSGIGSPVDMNVSYSRKADYVAEGLTIQKGQKVKPVLYGDNILSYRSADPLIASVDRNGVITGKSVGTVQITALSTNGSSDVIEIHVTEDLIPTDIYASMVYSNTITPLPGDCNLDGWINASDAAQVLVFAADKGCGNDAIVLDDLLYPAFDFNNDGLINASDANEVLLSSAQNGAEM